MYMRGSNGHTFITEKTILFQGSRGGPTFSSGVQLLPGGGRVHILISKVPHITCDFPGGPDPLSPPEDPHLNTEAVILIETAF